MNIFTNYKEFLDQIPWFYNTMTRDAIKDLLSRMGNFHLNLPVIHITGTNGKGSVTKAISSIYQTAGYRIGTFTSPYVFDYRECITINEETISISFMNKASHTVASLYHEMKKEGACLPTHYECITVIALYSFYLSKMDICIIEALMGGKDDATNVFDHPLATVITNVSLDHTEYLGNTISDIARHKAGIMKKKVPCILGKFNDEALQLIRELAYDIQSPMYDSQSYIQDKYTDNQILAYRHANKLKGNHQRDNLALTLSTIALLRKTYPVSHTSILKGLSNLIHPARLELITYNQRQWLIDGGHNSEGIDALVSYLQTNHSHSTITIILGMLEDKPYKEAIAKLSPLSNTMILVAPESPRAFHPETIYTQLDDSLKQKTRLARDIKDAYKMASHIDSNLILACGSFYTALPIRRFLVNSIGKE